MSLTLSVLAGTSLVWCLIVGSFTLHQMLFGVVLGGIYAISTQTWRSSVAPLSHLPKRFAYFAVYALILIPYDIVVSNFDLAKRLLRRTPLINPGIVRVTLGDIPPAASALVAHAITMTPGEIVVDYSDDGKMMYLHLIDVSAAESRRTEFWEIYHNVLEKVFL